jgi:hypothetical protein
VSSWLDPAADDVNIRWTRELAIRPFTTGSGYVNRLGGRGGSDRIKTAYGVNCELLVGLNNKYDPTNLFRHNQNI